MRFGSAPLGELCLPVPTWNPVRDSPDETFTYIDLSSVDQSSKTIANPQAVAGIDAPSRARQKLAGNDVVVATVRPNLNAVAIVPPGLDGATGSTGFCVLRADGDRLDVRYLYHWVRSSEFISEMVMKATGASYPAVSDRIVKQSVIPLPPLREQGKIAAVLDQSDRLLAKRRKALEVLDQLIESIFTDMFGDQRSNPNEFPTTTIGKIASIVVPTRDKPLRFDGCIPWITLPDLNGLELHSSQRQVDIDGSRVLANRLIPANSVLLSCAGSLGRVAINRVPVFANQQFYGIVPSDPRSSAMYLAASLKAKTSDFYRSLAGQSTIAYFSKGKAAEIELLWPPLEMQAKFGAQIEFILSVRASHATSLTVLHSLFVSLQSRLFRGEL